MASQVERILEGNASRLSRNWWIRYSLPVGNCKYTRHQEMDEGGWDDEEQAIINKEREEGPCLNGGLLW